MTFNNEIDPAENREEFIQRLDQIFDPFSNLEDLKNTLNLILMNDVQNLEKMKIHSKKMNDQKNKYIVFYDTAKTYEERKRVVASVKMN